MTHRHTFFVPSVLWVGSLPGDPHAQTSPNSPGHGAAISSPAAPLDPFLYQDMRWCERCAQMETFIEVYRLADGALGYFLGCGDERFVRFSRTVEAA